ncbi:MAG: hypothetical protein ACOC6K_02220 [Thermodesulfobacteriota bacterium]
MRPLFGPTSGSAATKTTEIFETNTWDTIQTIILVDLLAQPLGDQVSGQMVGSLIPVTLTKIATKPEGILETMKIDTMFISIFLKGWLVRTKNMFTILFFMVFSVTPKGKVV